VSPEPEQGPELVRVRLGQALPEQEQEPARERVSPEPVPA